MRTEAIDYNTSYIQNAQKYENEILLFANKIQNLTKEKNILRKERKTHIEEIKKSQQKSQKRTILIKDNDENSVTSTITDPESLTTNPKYLFILIPMNIFIW